MIVVVVFDEQYVAGVFSVFRYVVRVCVECEECDCYFLVGGVLGSV